VNKVLYCDCGFEASAADEAGLIAEVQHHAWTAHGMALSRDEALLLLFRAELGTTALAISPEAASRRDVRDRSG
jgi:hypothetical protein